MCIAMVSTCPFPSVSYLPVLPTLTVADEASIALLLTVSRFS